MSEKPNPRLNLTPLFPLADDDLRMRTFLNVWQDMHGGADPEYDWFRAEEDHAEYKLPYRATLPILDLTGYVHSAPPERVCQVVTTFMALLGQGVQETFLERAEQRFAHQQELEAGYREHAAARPGYEETTKSYAPHMSREEAYIFEWQKHVMPVEGSNSYLQVWIINDLTAKDIFYLNRAAHWLGSETGQVFLTKAKADLQQVFDAQRRERLTGVAHFLDKPVLG